MNDVRITTPDHLAPEDVEAVTALVAAAAAQDGASPVSEHTDLALRRGGDGLRQVLALAGSDVVGWAGVTGGDHATGGDGASAEIVVHPYHRRRGIGRRLVTAVLDHGPRTRFWAHGDLPAARALAAALGLVKVRELWVMRRPATDPLPDLTVPPGVRLRAFRPGQDDDAWVALNAAAFAEHPEQGAMTVRDLRERMAEPWFDADGFIVAEDAATGEMLGFHWTKTHPAEGDQRPVGEVYVVGVAPAAQGRGLGRVLTLAGLHHLARQDLGEVLLYVEADNDPAVRVYSGLGFTRSSADVQYAHPLPTRR